MDGTYNGIYTYSDLENLGRLGNQLWQIASTIGIAETNGGLALFRPDWEYRPFFSVPDKHFGSPLNSIQTYDRKGEYLQELHYWENIHDQIIGFFQSKEGTYYKPPSPSTAVHVRRGDYLKYPGHFPLPTMAYYENAMAEIRRESPLMMFYVFSDDIEWCRSAFSAHDDVVFISGVPRPVEVIYRKKVGPPQDQVDLFSMSSCDRHIISNSSFSWWGAMLSGDERTIYPTTWFGPELGDIPWRKMIPDTWEGIPC